MTMTLQASPIVSYVHAVRGSLRGPRRVRIDLVQELTDGLRDAAEAHRKTGLTRAEAEQRAVDESGAVDDVVSEFQPELVAGQGRRTAILLALGMPGLVFLWDLLWKVGGQEDSPTAPITLLLSDLVTWVGLAVGILGVVAIGALTFGARFAVPTGVVTRMLGVLGAVALGFTMVASIMMSFVSTDEAAGAFLSTWLGLLVLLATFLTVPALTFSVVRAIRSDPVGLAS